MQVATVLNRTVFWKRRFVMITFSFALLNSPLPFNFPENRQTPIHLAWQTRHTHSRKKRPWVSQNIKKSRARPSWCTNPHSHKRNRETVLPILQPYWWRRLCLNERGNNHKTHFFSLRRERSRRGFDVFFSFFGCAYAMDWERSTKKPNRDWCIHWSEFWKWAMGPRGASGGWL